jgi:hypothetical protein
VGREGHAALHILGRRQKVRSENYQRQRIRLNQWSTKRVILSFGASEKVKLHEARNLCEMTVAQQPDVLESCFGAFDNFEAVHCETRSGGTAARIAARRRL